MWTICFALFFIGFMGITYDGAEQNNTLKAGIGCMGMLIFGLLTGASFSAIS